MHSDFPPLSRQRHALFRLTEAQQRSLLKLLFSRYPHREWGSLLRFGFRRTPWGVSLSLVDTVPPGPDDLDRRSSIVEFRPAYIRKALRALETDDLGLGVIHSHPLGSATWPSDLDDDMDEYFAELFGPYGTHRPYVSLIVSRNRDGGLRFSGRVRDGDEWLPVRSWITVGESTLTRIPSELNETEETTASCSSGESAVARLETLLGQAAAKRLCESTVGILGCSGTGSPVAEILARAGVGSFVLVDYQSFARSNLERMHGSTRAHADLAKPPLKVAIVAEHIRAINPAAQIVVIAGNLLDEETWDALLQCDLVLSCTDTDHSRAALGDLANHYLVPSIDIAVLMEGANGALTAQVVEFVQYAAGLPCAFCDHRVHPHRLLYELLSEEEREQRRQAARRAEAQGVDGNQYWAGELPQLLTVGYLTTAAGSLAAGYAIGWLTGASRPPATRFQIDLGSPGLGYVAATRRARPKCSCNFDCGHADQARANRSISRPSHWPAAVVISVAS